jgi:hypothetical protein
MISIVLYGRNDSHGYNLHKRAAISINCMAEVLSDPDDEILFVDYNTPDDLPTFPEAIHDTLTPRAIAKLRILRVRPSQHRQFAAKTHLVALEPISRNVALRRSNPNNRWVLSTNTDMVFVPNLEGRSLTDVVRDIPDGFYHLPRFELPECMWESLDRRDPANIISSVGQWGKQYHLDEIVYGDHDNLYDAPGDFQLVLRSDLFAIHGFHEEMLIGWHVDSNLSRRMTLLRGQVKTLIGEVRGYHCDHTRQATLMHKRERLENDSSRFISNVVTPEVPGQAESWGLNGVEVEEIRLDKGAGSSARCLKALSATLAEPAQDFYETTYASETYNNLDYPVEHVLPYVVDLLSCAPEGVKVGYAGVRNDTFDLIARALATLDPDASIEPAPSADWLTGKPPVLADVDRWVAANDVYIFEIGETPRADEEMATRDSLRAMTVSGLFRRLVEIEDVRQAEEGQSPRRVIAINAIHTYFERRVSDALAHTLTPYSSRIRHGFVAPDRLPKEKASGGASDFARLGEMLSRGMGRTYPASASEVRRLVGIAERLPVVAEANTVEWSAALAVAEPLLALLRDIRTVGAIRRDPGELALIADLIEANRPSSNPDARLARFPVRDGQSKSASRLFDIEDWERPAWLNWARRYGEGRKVYDYLDRSPQVWERASILEELDRQLDFGAVSADNRPRILVMAPSAEFLAGSLLDLGVEVDIVDPRYFLDDAVNMLDWRHSLTVDALKLAVHAGLLPEQVEGRSARPYDAVVATQCSIQYGGHKRGGDILASLLPWVKPTGVLAFSALVQIDNDEDGDGFPRRAFTETKAAVEFQGATGFEPLRGFDVGLSRRTLDRIGHPDRQASELAPVLEGPQNQWLRSLWFWRAGRLAGRVDANRLSQLFSLRVEDEPEDKITPLRPAPPAQAPRQTVAGLSRPALPASSRQPFATGGQMGRVEATGGGKRSPRGVRVERAAPSGVFAAASLGAAVPGAYEVIVEVNVPRSDTPGAIALGVEVLSGDAVMHRADFTARDLMAKTRRAVEFEISEAKGVTGVRPLEVRLIHHGACDMELLNLSAYSGARV